MKIINWLLSHFRKKTPTRTYDSTFFERAKPDLVRQHFTRQKDTEIAFRRIHPDDDIEYRQRTKPDRDEYRRKVGDEFDYSSMGGGSSMGADDWEAKDSMGGTGDGW